MTGLRSPAADSSSFRHRSPLRCLQASREDAQTGSSRPRRSRPESERSSRPWPTRSCHRTRIPAGKAAGLADFIDIQLRGPYARFVPAYRDGLARLDQTSRRLRQESFVVSRSTTRLRCSRPSRRTRCPPGIWKPREASEFFRLICDHCMQGYYGSPRHGGNRGAASWKMLKLDYPQLAGRVT